VRLAPAARALDLGLMLGCMVESGLGIAAGAQIASLMDHVDLDGNLLLADDPWPGVDFVDGIQRPSPRPGLGVETHGVEIRGVDRHGVEMHGVETGGVETHGVPAA